MRTIELRPYQQEIIDKINSVEECRYAVVLATGLGKAQPIYSQILTPNGYVKMGDIKIGDKVIAGNGEETIVTGIFPQGIRPIYRITFTDKTSVDCDLEHLWVAKRKGRKTWRTVTTKEIMDCPCKRNDYYIPLLKIDREEKAFDISPYVLGVLLGDGCLTGKAVCWSTPDKDRFIVDKMTSLLEDYKIYENRNPCCPEYYISKKKGMGLYNPIKKALINYGLWGKKSKDKFIPECYFWGSIKQRLELLNGLMDTDGTAKNNRVAFCTCSEKLANDVARLCQSIGGVALIRHYKRKDGKSDDFQVNIRIDENPFSLPRKMEQVWERKKFKPNKKVENVEYLGDIECQCIMVDNEDHTYVTDNSVVTHNTVCFTHLKRKGKMLILSHRNELVYQPLKYLMQQGIVCGVEKADKSPDHTEEVISASVQSISRRLGNYDPDEFEIIVVDEMHHSAAKSYRKIIDYFNYKKLIGFTATPNRADYVRLDDIYKEVICDKNIIWGIENGYLCNIKCLRVNLDFDLTNVGKSNGDFIQSELGDAMEGTGAGIAEVYNKHHKGKTIIFASSVKHAYEIKEYIEGSEVIEGKTPKDARERILNEFANGDINCIINNMCLTEGYDNPKIETVIMCRPTLNTSLVCQCVGRSTRLCEGKEYAKVIDIVGISDHNLVTAASLVGINLPDNVKKKIEKEETELDLLDIPQFVRKHEDVPENWIRSIKEVDLFAKKQKYKTYDMNLRKRSSGEFVLEIPSKTFTIPPIDAKGNVTFDNDKIVDFQNALDKLFVTLRDKYASEEILWNKKLINKWGNKPITDKQKSMLNWKYKESKETGMIGGLKLDDLTANEASIIISETLKRRNKK